MLNDISLCILDIAVNSFKSGAKNIGISLIKSDDRFLFEINDDGCGISADTLDKIHKSIDKPEKGTSFNGLKGLYKACGGNCKISYDDIIGTKVTARFLPDFPLGDISGTIMCLLNLCGQGDVMLDFSIECEDKSFTVNSISLYERWCVKEKYYSSKRYVQEGVTEVFKK